MPKKTPEILFIAKLFLLFITLSMEEDENNTEENHDISITYLLPEAYAHIKSLIYTHLAMGLIIFSFCSYEQQSIITS